jgi:hypothetical protein
MTIESVANKTFRVKREATWFGVWQEHYTIYGIPTFPVDIDKKKPMVANYGKFGLPASRALVKQPRFANVEAIGFVVGKRNNLTILDIDTTDERVLADCLDKHGNSPIIVRTASGKFHVWYRHNRELRSIKVFANVDLLGGGLVVAPPTKKNNGTYQFIEGNLDNLVELKPIKNIGSTGLKLEVPDGVYDDHSSYSPTHIPQGVRNKRLWEFCMRKAHYCDNLAALIEHARDFYATCCEHNTPPTKDSEIMATAESAWKITERGDNRFSGYGGEFGLWIPSLGHDLDDLIENHPDVFRLIAFLRRNNGYHSRFMIANALATKFGWGDKRLAAARNRILELGYVQEVRAASSAYGPALYRWIH